MLEHAAAAIQAGPRRGRRPRLRLDDAGRPEEGPAARQPQLRHPRARSQFDAPYGHTLIAKYAMAARRHMHEFGTTIEQLAEIAVSARYNAGLNPDAYYRDPITIDDVQSAPMIADPFTTLHCCIRSDGGGAVVSRARSGPATAPRRRCGCSAPARRRRTRR